MPIPCNIYKHEILTQWVTRIYHFITQPSTHGLPGRPSQKASIWSAADQRSHLAHTNNFKTGILKATLPDAWHYRVSAGTGCPCFSRHWMNEIAKFDLQLLSLCGKTWNSLSTDVPATISRVSDQNGVSPLHIMLEIHLSGREPSIWCILVGNPPYGLPAGA